MKLTIVTGFFLPVPPVLGGSTEKIWHRLAVLFATAGHEVTFISRAWPNFASRETVAGVTHLRLPGADHTRSLARNLLHDFFWSLRVARTLPPGDIVICNTVTLPVWLRRVKPSAGRVVAVLARMPKGHGRAYGGVDLLLSLSAAVTEKIRAENPRLASRIAPFPFPIDWALHAAAHRARPPISPTPLTIGYIGRLHPEKGLRLLLAAAARLAARADLPPWQLTLRGPSAIAEGGGGEPFRAALLAEFSSVLGARLTLAAPEFAPAPLAAHYAALDIFCYPSLAESGETFGVAVAEAMAAGVAPVVSDLPCFRELVQDGDTGLVFNHAASDAASHLATVLARLLADAPLRCTLATRAQAHVRRYDFPAVATTLLSTLAALSPPDAVTPASVSH